MIDYDEDDDGLGCCRGMVWALPLSIAMWVCVLMVLWAGLE